MSQQKLDQLDLIELQQVLTELESDDCNDLEQALYDKYGIDSENFENLINDLFQMLTLAISPLSGSAFVGFGSEGIWALKKDITSEFINSVIEFCLDGEKYDLSGKGYRRTITLDDKPEYELVITKPENTIVITKPEN